MPTSAQVANRANPPPADRHYPAVVVTAGTPTVVALDPGGAQTTALAVNAGAYTAGQRVLVLVTAAGNYILGRI